MNGFCHWKMAFLACSAPNGAEDRTRRSRTVTSSPGLCPHQSALRYLHSQMCQSRAWGGTSGQVAFWASRQWAEGDFMLYHSQETRQRAQNYGLCSEGVCINSWKTNDCSVFAVWGFKKKSIFKGMNSKRPTTCEVNCKISGPPLDLNKASVKYSQRTGRNTRWKCAQECIWKAHHIINCTSYRTGNFQNKNISTEKLNTGIFALW